MIFFLGFCAATETYVRILRSKISRYASKRVLLAYYVQQELFYDDKWLRERPREPLRLVILCVCSIDTSTTRK